MKRVLFISHVLSMITQFNRYNIEILQDMGYEIHIACNLNEYSVMPKEQIKNLVEEYRNRGVVFHQVDFLRGFAAYRIILKSYRQLSMILREGDYEIVHCHSQIAGLCGRIAAHRFGVKTIYTSHGFMFFKGAPIINWLLFFPQEWLLARFTDVLITINKEDYQLAKKYLHARKIEYIPGVGISVQNFSGISINRREKCKVLGIPEDAVILLSVGELNTNKNHEIVIRALAKIHRSNLYYLIAGKGDLYDELQKLAKRLGISEQVHLLGWRKDVPELYQIADIFIHPSYREGLPVAVMEAIASRTFVLCSDIRGNNDLVERQYTFAPTDIDKLVDLIKNVIEKDHSNVVECNYERLKNFDLQVVNSDMRKLYMNCVGGGRTRLP